VTDGSGQYRIINLQPGNYAMSFTLPGFNTVKRENIQLSGSQVVTIPIDMKVGGVEETITVTGETPVVDVQSVKREVVMNQSVIQTIPANRRGRNSTRRPTHRRHERPGATADDDVLQRAIQRAECDVGGWRRPYDD
jgi:hypothetical protein